MSENFLGEIKMIGIRYAPKDWAYCDGQRLAVNQNQALYSLLGAQFGSDNQTYFTLPDLRGRAPVHPGAGLTQGMAIGEETVTLTPEQMPQHTHMLLASASAGTARDAAPAGTMTFAQAVLAKDQNAVNIYGAPQAQGMTALAADTTTPAGGGVAHANVQPSLVIGFCIALQGIYPSRN